MKYYKNLSDGYYDSLTTGSGQTEITKAEYDDTVAILRACPAAPNGYAYRLKEDLTWELYELPPEPEEDAEPEDYEAALGRLGVNTNDQD